MIAYVRTHPETQAPAFVLALGLAAILAAWGFQLIGGYVPCKLCLEQRIPYYVGLPVVLVALGAALAGLPIRMISLLMAVAALVFALGAGLGVYHAGIEWGWWAGPADCGVGGGGPTGSVDDLLGQLEGIRIVSCAEASWRFPPTSWGLSFAGWNAAISATLAAVALFGAFRGLRAHGIGEHRADAP